MKQKLLVPIHLAFSYILYQFYQQTWHITFSYHLRGGSVCKGTVVFPISYEYKIVMTFFYRGEMTVAAEDLTSLLKTAEILQVSGLAPSDSSATVNPQTESLPMGNVRSSSNSSSSASSSSNIPIVSRASKIVKTPSQSLTTPPARPKSIESMINPADFIDVDMTCVKEVSHTCKNLLYQGNHNKKCVKSVLLSTTSMNPCTRQDKAGNISHTCKHNTGKRCL